MIITEYAAPLIFLSIGIAGFAAVDISGKFIMHEVYLRFIRNVITAMALIIPIWAGMGLNFSIVVGAMCSQAAVISAVDKGIDGQLGLIYVIAASAIISLIFGYIIGIILNKARGKEMIVSIVVGLLSTNIYQLIYMVGYGTIIKPENSEIILSRGIGIRNMVDINALKSVFMSSPFSHIAVIVMIGLLITFIGNSKFGVCLRATRDSIEKARILGIDTDKVRIYAIILSTVFASVGHCMFMLEMGNVNVYTGHMNIDVFASAALLAGGASLFNADVRNAFIGVILFHFVFVISPLFGKVIFNDIAIGEYFRSFIAYAVIVVVFIMNLKDHTENYRL